MLCARGTDVIAGEPANEKGVGLSMATDSRPRNEREVRQARVPDGGEGGVCLQEVGDDLSTLHFQGIVAQTANKRQMGASEAIDSNGKATMGRRRRTQC